MPVTYGILLQCRLPWLFAHKQKNVSAYPLFFRTETVHTDYIFLRYVLWYILPDGRCIVYEKNIPDIGFLSRKQSCLANRFGTTTRQFFLTPVLFLRDNVDILDSYLRIM